MTVRQPVPESDTVAVKKGAGKKMPEDMGLMPGTFVMPTGTRRPSLLSKPGQWLRLERHRIWTRCTDLFSLLIYKWGTKKSKPRPKLQQPKIIPEAMRLYSQMYTAFAEGDNSKLSSICAEGMGSSLHSRIAARPRNQRLQWTLHKYIRRPRVVVNRAASLPLKESALRQVVLRMQTRQSLAKLKTTSAGKPDIIIAGTGEEKDVKEYLVLQRRMLNGQEGPWKIWGTTDETDIKDILKDKESPLH